MSNVVYTKSTQLKIEQIPKNQSIVNDPLPATAMFSDFVVFVDESGDHSLESIDTQYPVFVLSFCVFRKDDYANQIAPRIRELKFNTFGHDMVILHEIDIRRRRKAFSHLGKEARESFMDSLTDIIDAANFQIVAVVIDKAALVGKYSNPAHPYYLALGFGLERISKLVRSSTDQEPGTTHIVCEARGRKEDSELELAFRRLCTGNDQLARITVPFDLQIADKKCNSEGLQLADLTARPIGLNKIRPGQPNRAYECLSNKFWRNEYGFVEGLKTFP